MLQRKETQKKALELLKFAFAHHPTCELFRDHLYHIRGVWVCKTCVIAYPVTGIVFLLSIITELPLSNSFTIAVVAFLITLVTSIGIFHLKFAIIRRLIFGVFTGTAIYFLLLYGDLLVLIFGLIFVYSILILFSFIRYFNMKNICDSCFYSGDWERCDGFLGMKRILFRDTIWEIESKKIMS
ncbi:MAG: hypothetical protein ACFE95_08335 [Candidatus Hodarchaeota archaeon]